MKNALIILILGLSICSCGNKKVATYHDCNIDSILVKYLCRDITFARPLRGVDLLNWKSVKKPEALKDKYAKLVDTVITNCESLKEIEKEMKNLKIGKCYDEDAYFVSVVFYKNNTKDTICFSYANGFSSIMRNNICQEENRIIEHLLYKYSDYYSWYPNLEKYDSIMNSQIK